MHNLDLLITLAGCLAAALVCGYITFRLGLSPIVGYLLAGLVVGPYTPGFVADRHIAEQTAEVGVILLMFGVGLQFHLKELLAVRRVAVPGAIVQSVAATVLGTILGFVAGWGLVAGLVFGLAISVASTVVLIRVLSDNEDLHTPTGHIAVGWLVVEDLFTVLVLVALPALFGQAPARGGPLLAILIASLKVALMIGVVYVLGGRVIPWVLDRVAATRSRELFTLTVLVVALGIAVGSAQLFDVSVALGAFLAGLVVGRSEFSLRAATEALPMRDAFAVLFFVSVGFLFNPASLLESPAALAATLAIILVGKPLAALAIVLALRYPLRVAVGVAVVLAQIGEFSFILATAGKALGILQENHANLLIVASIISITLNPVFYRLAGPFERLLQRILPARWLAAKTHVAAATLPDDPGQPRAIVVGYGPVGRTLVRLLRENEFTPVVVEMNLDTVRQLTNAGVTALYGDATLPDTLREAGAEHAVALILTSASMPHSAEAIRAARELNPNIRILARSNYLAEAPDLRRAGASSVFSGEGEIALAMTEALLRQFGATPEQIDRHRDRIRAELFEGTASRH